MMAPSHQQTVQEQFTKTADAFARYVVRDTPEMVAEKVAFAQVRAADLLLDVCCGPGAFLLAVAPLVRFARGIDLTEEMIRQARAFQAERRIRNVYFERGEAERLPYGDGVFDFVTSQYAFHHLPAPGVVLQEMIRVAKPGSRLLLIDSLAPEADVRWDLHNRIEVLRDPSHTQTLRLTDFRDMFRAAGLQVVRQLIKRRERSFNHWMRRAGLEPGEERYTEVCRLMEQSMPQDAAGFMPRVKGDDLIITHYEGLFLLLVPEPG
jgi:ubiquinone/menaquinone biosynthesis C-methylase UbiE